MRLISRTVAAGIAVALGISGCSSTDATSSSASESESEITTPNSPTAPTQDVEKGTPERPSQLNRAALKPGKTVSALTVLRSLKTGPRQVSGYDRSYFPHWIWIGSCNTRGLVLKRDSEVPTTTRGACTVETGRWRSYYDGLVLTQAREIDIDHMVPLAEAWRSGANTWTTPTRESFANDLGYRWSLIPVSASSNRSKSDGDPASWIPKKTYQCRYAKNWVTVKYRWSLSVDQSERNALTRLIQACADPSIKVPTKATIRHGSTNSSSSKAGNNRHQGQSQLKRESSVHYRTCADARRAGAAPLRRGDPGYSRHLDRDNDGIACE